MEPKPINITVRVIFSRLIFESAGFSFGCFIGVLLGFMMGFIYAVFPWGVP